MMPRRVQLAVLLAFLFHGVFILTAHYRGSYDAYTHMLFADHYAWDWFSLWETRWYTGFTVVSYPPLTHQLVALFIPVLGFDRAFALILWVLATLYPLGIYVFSRIFVGRSAALYVALASALLTPIYVVAYVYGQLPFLLSTLLALFCAASLNCYIRKGGIHYLFLTASLYATAMASHHATLLIQPFLFFAVVWNYFLGTPRPFQWRQFIVRLLLVGSFAVLLSLLVIWPFWEWGTTQVMQTPIDHLSRHNFLHDPFAFLIFFIPLYGPFMTIIPFVFWKWPRRLWGLILSFTVLLLLGLGGTTALPRWLFGRNWEWLIYDRFAFWACLMLTPFFGVLFIRAKRRFAVKAISRFSSRDFFKTLTVTVFAVTILLVWLQPYLFPTQPARVDMQPIVDFLNQGDHSQWRYLTFGFGNQYTYLNLLTKATTIDGSYHTARTLPELRNSGVGEVDTAYWIINGMNAIVPILKRSGEHGVRWGFVDPNTVEVIRSNDGVTRHSPFIPVLENLGWVKVKTLDNGVFVYENPKAMLPPPIQPPRKTPFASFSWGIFPMLSLITTLCLGGLKICPVPAERVIRAIYTFAVGLIPIGLCFWHYKTIFEFPQPRVYFPYTDALFYFSDALAVLAIVLWASTKIASLPKSQNIFFLSAGKWTQNGTSRQFLLLLSALLLFASFSILWSKAWHTSTYISLHLWLILLLILSLRDWHNSWNVAMFGLCAALSIEIITGLIGFVLQSTSFLESLDMKWPGILEASAQGASVVQLSNGLRILRAYGTLPHPNILGGFLLFVMLGPISLFFNSKKPNYPALILLCFGLILLVLTFSRSAWLGWLAFVLVLLIKFRHLDRKRLILFISATAMAVLLTGIPLRELIFSRLTNLEIATETISSVGRSWLAQQAMDIIQKHPLTGVGVGSFIIELAKNAVPGAPIEPVHNVFLLMTAELGIVGFILLLGLCIAIASTVIRSKSPRAIFAGALVTGLGVINLFDHYLWTLAPGRLMLGLAIGLWAGQVAHDA